MGREGGEIMLDKKLFYDVLKPFTNKHIPINFFFRFGTHYELIFNWENRRPNGDFNPKMNAQLIDLSKQGYHKYVVPDLIFDCQKEKVTTDYKLYKYLDKWVTAALAQEGEAK